MDILPYRDTLFTSVYGVGIHYSLVIMVWGYTIP